MNLKSDDLSGEARASKRVKESLTVILSEATVILSEATVILSEATVILSEATVILSEAKDLRSCFCSSY